MNKKGDFLESKLIVVIVSLVFLLIMFFFISSQIDSSKLQNAQSSCSTLFSNIGSLYYDGNDDFKEQFWTISSNTCSSFSTTIEEDEISKAGNYLDRCWKMTAGDNDVMPPAYKGGVCVYCGDLSLDENYDYSIFREDLAGELQREKYKYLLDTTTITSLNPLLLSPQTFPINNDVKKLGVVVYSYKGEFSNLESISNSGIALSLSVASILGSENLANEFFDKSVGSFRETQKGIAFVEYDEELGPLVGGEPIDQALRCEVIVPNKNIDY